MYDRADHRGITSETNFTHELCKFVVFNLYLSIPAFYYTEPKQNLGCIYSFSCTDGGRLLIKIVYKSKFDHSATYSGFVVENKKYAAREHIMGIYLFSPPLQKKSAWNVQNVTGV